MDFIFGFQETKLKPYLKMAVQRLQIAYNKKSTAVKHQKREIAKLLEDSKEEKARIKVEHVIREDFTMESYELIELLCELMHERVRYLSSEKECPSDLLEAVSTLIWCANKVDIAELAEVKKQLTLKFGTQFAKDACENTRGKVNERLMSKLAVAPPSALLVVSYLKEIAKEYGVDWTPTDIGVNNLSEAVPTPVGFSIPMAPGSEFRSVYQRNNNDSSGNSSGGGSVTASYLAANPAAPAPAVLPYFPAPAPSLPPPSYAATTNAAPETPAAAPAPEVPAHAPAPSAAPIPPSVAIATPVSPPAAGGSASEPPPASTGSSANASAGPGAPSYDDLALRFAALKNNK